MLSLAFLDYQLEKVCFNKIFLLLSHCKSKIYLPLIMKKVSAVVLIASISFFILTATSAKIGVDFSYRQDTYGWPNQFFTVTYEKAAITNLEINAANMFFNYLLCLVVVGSIRLTFLFMKVKRQPAQYTNASLISPVK